MLNLVVRKESARLYKVKHTLYLKWKSGTRINQSSMAEEVSRWAVTTKAQVRSQVSPYEICGGQSGTGTGLSTSFFPCQYHSTNAPYPFIHLPPTLYNVSLPVLQFSPVSIIPPMLHTHHLSPTLHVYKCNNGQLHWTRLKSTRAARFNIQKLNFPAQCVYVLSAVLKT